MNIKYKYMDPSDDASQVVDFTKDQLVPMLEKYWETRGKEIYDRAFSFSVQAFTPYYMAGALVVVMALDMDDKRTGISVKDNQPYEYYQPVGFVVGMVSNPMLYQANVVQAEVWHAPDDKVRDEMFQYFAEVLRIKNINEIWIQDTNLTQNFISWPRAGSFTVTRYTKG